MLQAATSLGRNGLQDWIIQRISAIILALYTIGFFGLFIIHPSLDYATWKNLFTNPWIKVFHLLVLLSLLFHAWIGFWTISTDYIKHASTRLTMQVIILYLLFFMLAWGVFIIWSV